MSDAGTAVARSYALVFALSVDDRELHSSVGIDLAGFDGDDSWELPAAPVFIVDADSMIRFASGKGYGALEVRLSRNARARVWLLLVSRS